MTAVMLETALQSSKLPYLGVRYFRDPLAEKPGTREYAVTHRTSGDRQDGSSRDSRAAHLVCCCSNLLRNYEVSCYSCPSLFQSALA